MEKVRQDCALGLLSVWPSAATLKPKMQLWCETKFISSPLVAETGPNAWYVFSNDCSSHIEEHDLDWPLMQVCLPDNPVTCEFLAVSFLPGDITVLDSKALWPS